MTTGAREPSGANPSLSLYASRYYFSDLGLLPVALDSLGVQRRRVGSNHCRQSNRPPGLTRRHTRKSQGAVAATARRPLQARVGLAHIGRN